MDKETFLEEEKKLKITVDKIIEEEENIQNTLSKNYAVWHGKFGKRACVTDVCKQIRQYEKIEGEIFLKRQYIIEKGRLKKYVDINVTGNDELLQNALEEKADDRLKNIVATIQDEQNKIIRAPINSPLIVQGVAGSRKNYDCIT